MSTLRDSFYEGTTGLLQQCDAAFAAGQAVVTTNNAAIAAGLQSNAALGLTEFIINVPVTYQTAALRGNKGNNLILKSFLDGIVDGFAQQNIYSYQVNPTLNVSDTITTSVDLNFTF